jgi:mRNA interferase MazF
MEGLRRGDLWTAAGGAPYSRKPRPVVIIQDDRFDTDSITVCPLTTDATPTPLVRVPIEPRPDNGLRHRSFVMVDKINTIRRARIGRRLGHLGAEDLAALERAVLVFLGFATRGR